MGYKSFIGRSLGDHLLFSKYSFSTFHLLILIELFILEALQTVKLSIKANICT